MNQISYHHVSLRVASARRASRFYAALFGFREVLRHEVEGGGEILHLAQGDGPPLLEIIEDAQPVSAPAHAVHLGFSCTDIDEVLARLAEVGVGVERGPLEVGRERLLFIRDPDGYLIEINDGL